MQPKIKILLLAFTTLLSASLQAQVKDSTAVTRDTTDLMSRLENETLENNKDSTYYARATFKTTRLINGHTVENVGKGVMDVKISHRFNSLNSGAYQFFGLDDANTRLGLDYGITNNFMVGIGRSSYKKAYDAFFKLKILRQSTGKINMPITLSYVPTIVLNTLHGPDSAKTNYFSSKLFFSHQLIIGRKFSTNTSLQLMPTFVHRNLAPRVQDPNDLLSIGIGGRQKISKRVSINAEYYYQIPGSQTEWHDQSREATGGIDARLHAPLARTTVRQRHAFTVRHHPVATLQRLHGGHRGVLDGVDVRGTALHEGHDFAARHEAVGVVTVVVRPGSRFCQFGVRRRSESHRSVRHEFATSPRSRTMWSIERSVRRRLIASPALPAPMITVVTCIIASLPPPTVSGCDSGRSCGQATSTVTLVGFVMMSRHRRSLLRLGDEAVDVARATRRRRWRTGP